MKTFQIEEVPITRIIWVPELKSILTTSLKGDVKLIDPFDKEIPFNLLKQFKEDSAINHLVVIGRLAYEGTKLIEDESLIDETKSGTSTKVIEAKFNEPSVPDTRIIQTHKIRENSNILTGTVRK